MGYLNNDGLLYLWTKIKNTFVAQESGKGLSTNDYTTTEKNKLNGIASGATKNTVENVLTSDSTTNALSAAQGKALKGLIDAKGTGDMSKSTYDTNGNGIVDNAEKVNGKTVGVDVPADAKFTDTVYTHPTTAGNKHIPSGGSSGQILEYSDAGTAKWSSPSKSMVGLGNVDNTSDADKPVSKATSLALATKADLVHNHDDDYDAKGSADIALYNAKVYAENAVSDGIAALESIYAKKTDLTNLYKYKGSVANESALPTTGLTVGDVYDIQAASSYGGVGMNVAWTGSKWDALGEIFSITSITNAEIDTVCV